MLCLVTGATGFVGSHLVDALLKKGHRVRVTVRKTSKLAWLDGKPMERVEADLRDGRGLEAAMDGVDVAYHVAGVINAPREEDYRAGNWLATKHAIEAAVRAKVRRFVHVSSLAAGGPSKDGTPATEDREPAPVSVYGKTKLEGELEALRHRGEIEVAAARPPVVYGPRDTGLFDMYKVLTTGVKPQFGDEKFISIIHIDDLVPGLIACGEHPAAAGECFYLANEAWHAQGQVMDFILNALGKKAVGVGIPDRVLRFLGGVAEDTFKLLGKHSMFNRDKALEMTQRAWICSPAKAKQRLGWASQVDIEQGLKATLDWYRAQKWL
jgi:nucleoside-diphosphate-sugar epimerase